MKKILLFASALAGLFLAGSCQRENLEPMESANTVTYTVQLSDAVGTKALGDDINAVDELVYEVWRTKVEETKTFTNEDNLLYHKTAPITNGVATIELEFVNNQHFTVLFWAHTAGNDVYDVDELTAVSIASSPVANNPYAQAFVGRDFVRNCVSDANGKVTLVRPVSQLNIATTPESLVFEAEADEKGSTITLNGSSVKVSGLATSYNIATLRAFGKTETEYTYTETPVPAYPLTVNDKAYTYVAMNYVGFAANDGSSGVTVSYEINTSEGKINNKILNVPVKPNFRTNIVGNLITAKTGYTITLDKTWGTPEEVVNLWDGTSINAPKINEAGQYVIAEPSELAWLAAAVNGTLPPETRATVEADDYKGKTFILIKDIDLNGQSWTPIGTSEHPFKGTFDGNRKTIRNLVVNGGKSSNQGLFGHTTDGEIKNVTIENAKVSGRLNVGVIAGTPYTSKYSDIIVKGHVEVDGMAYVGGVAGKNAYASWNNITVDVDETSYVNANSVENGIAYRTYVGGVVGFNGEGGHSFKNIRSNIDVKGSTIDVGGLFGIAHYGNHFENCSCSGNVEIYAAEESAEAEEIGGIAGVWHNETGHQVTFTNCEYTGTLKVNVKGVDLNDNTLVGAHYSATGSGVLVVDGKNFYGDLASINAALEKGEYVGLYRDVEADAAASNGYGKTGVQLHNGGTLDGNGHTLTINNAGATWDSAISITGGKVKNLTVTRAFRGIFMPGAKADVYIENVTFKDVVYTFNSDAGNKDYGVYLSNCIINGWTSHSDVHKEVIYTECSFGQGSGYKFCRPYGPTTYVNCTFCEGYEIEALGKVVFENCTLNGVAITEENYTQLVTGNAANVSWPVLAENTKTLQAALSEGKDVVLANDLTIAASEMVTAPYGNKTAVIHNGGVFDGNNKTINQTAGGDNYVVMTNGGTIKNLTINEGFRGIVVMSANQTIYLDNVVSSGDVCYALNTAEGDSTQDLVASNCTFDGWSSWALLKSATFTKCSFGQGDYYTNVSGRLGKPYVNTLFDGCEFCSKYYIDLSSLGAGQKVTLKNCTVNGVKLTAQNWTSLVASEATCGDGQISIELKDGSYMTADNVADYIVFE